MQGDKLRELLTEAVGFAPYDLRDSARLALYELLAIADGAEADRADARRLDWLAKNWLATAGGTQRVHELIAATFIWHGGLRAAIDAALAGAVTQGEGQS